MSAYYNEHDKHAVAWLRELIKAGAIADGEVDDRSILDVCPDDLRGFTQCHFFAGIGGWSLALRLAEWPDDRTIWTGSCPCQSFSAAGRGAGFADERHLWPAWFHLIDGSRPPVVAGEQVEAAISHGWLDLVCDDLEGIGYAVAPVGLPAACVGSPTIRQRLWFVAKSENAHGRREQPAGGQRRGWAGLAGDGEVGLVADAEHAERRPLSVDRVNGCDGTNSGRQEAHGQSGACGEVRGLADRDEAGRSLERLSELRQDGDPQPRNDADGCGETGGMGDRHDTRPQGRGERGNRPDECAALAASVARPWADIEWLPCRDGKSRPTQPGLQPLAHGVPARVGRLRGYGNAIVPQVAAEVMKAYMAVTA